MSTESTVEHDFTHLENYPDDHFDERCKFIQIEIDRLRKVAYEGFSSDITFYSELKADEWESRLRVIIKEKQK